MPIQKLETNNVLKEWLDTINAMIDDNDTVKQNVDTKVDKVTGKGLSTEDFTTALKTKLEGVEDGANKYVLPTASDTKTGGVVLSDSTSSDSSTLDGVAATPKAVKEAYDLANNALPKTGGIISGDLTVEGNINATISGNSETATKLVTPRAISLSGGATGTGSFDGSSDVELNVTVDGSKHTHTISNVNGLQNALVGKAPINSPSLLGKPTAPTANTETNDGQIATTEFVHNVISEKIAASDAMIFKGTIGENGTISSLPITHSTGWTYKVVTAGVYAGVECNVGDMIVCLFDGDSENDGDWTVIEGNIDGAVTGPASAVDNQVAIFDGATGKVIKDSGFTIKSSVPVDAKFTDTTYTGSDGIILTGTNFTNSGVRSISTGSINGTISVDTNGVSDEVSVAGLKSAAYTDASEYTPSNHVSVYSTANTLGHVNLSDSTSSNSDASSGVAATPKAVKEAYDLANNALPKTGGIVTGDVTIEGELHATIRGNADTATDAGKLSTPRNITFSGDVGGSYYFDGSENVEVELTVVDDSHNHIIENIDGLQGFIDEKAPLNSPSFTGTPTAPTASLGVNNSQIATTAFVTTTVEAAVDGVVRSPVNAVVGRIAVFADSNGDSIKDSGYTIASSVPADAKFTDTNTTYTGSDGIILTGTNFTNSGVRSVSSGETNGTISVNTNGVSNEVSVAGLKSAAYTDASEYVPISHITSTSKNIGSIGDANTYGHLKLSDAINLNSTTSSGIAATPAAVKKAYDLANSALPKTGGTISGDLTVTGKINASIEGVANSAISAEKLSKEVTISFSGDAEGSVSFDGSENVEVELTVADDSHNHIIENIDGLQSVIDEKAPLTSPALTGTPTAPTATAGTNNTQVATTAFVTTAVKNQATTDASTYATKTELSNIGDSLATVATSGRYEDLIGTPTSLKNPTSLTIQNSAGTSIGSYDGSTAETVKLDASTVGLGNVTNESKATMFTSPALTGTPTAPTATAGTNTTQVATTAFVTTAVKNQATTDASTYATKSELSDFEDSLATVATSGSYNDLSNKPTSLKNPTSLTIQNSAGTSIGSYDGSTAETVKLDASTVGLGNVTNESKATMFTSPSFTGTPTAPTAAAGTNTTQVATTEFVKTAVDAKTSVSGNAGSATKLENPIEFSLEGDVTGTVSFDGSGTLNTNGKIPVILSVAVDGTKHSHTISNVDGLQNALVGKASINSPSFTGEPLVNTPKDTANVKQIANVDYVNNAVSSKVDGPSSSTTNNVAIFNGTTGKIIKDSGFTIAKSVPSDAEFTDNSVTQTSTVDNANYPIIMKYIANNINSTEGVRYATNVTINPSTGNITASSFTGSLDGTAERATSDSIGNVITDTYATKTELSELDESLATVATSGSYNDLSDKPTSLKNPTSLTIQNSAGTSITAYDGSTAKTVKLDASTVGLGNVTNESKATMFTSPALTGTPTAPTAAAGTNNTQIATTAFVQSLVDSKIAAADAMIYKGTIGTNGTVTALPNTHKTGWTYKVITAGVYAGVKCNVGDMIICLADGTSANNAHWSVIEGNIDGGVTGPSYAVANNIAIFDGATGKIIKDSGFTIAKSVPSDAKFTDTTYSQATTSTLGLVKLTDTLSSSGVSTGVAATPQLVNSTLNNYYTKTQIDEFVNDLRVDDVTGSEYIMTLTSGYSANHVYELGNFTYPRGMDAVRVSLDGFTLSKGIHYEEVQSSSTSIYSNQIKLLVDTEAEMVLHIWVAPVAVQVSALEDKVIAAQGYAEIAQEVGDRLGSVGASVFPFKGSTTTTVGTEGLVPKPAAGNSERYLNCEGTWKELNAVVGATATTHGTAGLVPAPMKGQESLFLRGDGTWQEVVVEGVDNLLSKSGGEMEGNLITKGVFGVVSALTGSNINLSTASTFTKTITGNTTFTIDGVPASTSAVFTLVLTNGGNHVVTYPTNMKWASGEVPTLTADGVDILTFITVDGGNTWYGSPSIINANLAVI